MVERFNPLDPLGIFGRVKQDIDRIASSTLNLPLPGPPGLARRTEEERAARHQAAYGGSPPAERGAGLQRLLDPLGLFSRSGGSIGNPIPVEFDGRLVELKETARRNLVTAGYPESLVNRALTWYDEWLMGMARRLAPGNTELQRSVVQSAYAEVAPRAESWMRGIQAAFGV